MNTARETSLEGIMVLELGHTVMGPTCGLVLADMGADVYKVERPGKGDDTRWLKGFGAGFFTYFNRNKKAFRSTSVRKRQSDPAHAGREGRCSH